MARRVLGRKGLKDKGVLYSNVHLLRLEKQEKFPKRIQLSENRVGWIEEEVDAWIDHRIAERDLSAAPPPSNLAKPRDPRTVAPDANAAPTAPPTLSKRRTGPPDPQTIAMEPA